MKLRGLFHLLGRLGIGKLAREERRCVRTRARQNGQQYAADQVADEWRSPLMAM
jgi:hypothetical protein